MPRASAARGSAAAPCATWARAPATARAVSCGASPVSVAQHFDQVADLRPSGELQEQLLEARVAGAVLPPQVVHRPLRHDLAVLDDGDALAPRLGPLPREGARPDAAPAADRRAA